MQSGVEDSSPPRSNYFQSLTVRYELQLRDMRKKQRQRDYIKKKVERQRALAEDCWFDSHLQFIYQLNSLVSQYEEGVKAYWRMKKPKPRDFQQRIEVVDWKRYKFSQEQAQVLQHCGRLKQFVGEQSVNDNLLAGVVNGQLQGRFDKRIKDCEHW